MTTAKTHRVWHDEDGYRKLSTPFKDETEAQDAVGAFFDAVRRLREQYHLRDVVVAVEVTMMVDGRSVSGHSAQALGDNSRTPHMLRRAGKTLALAIENSVPPWGDADGSETP